MAKKEKDTKVTLVCSECKHENYHSTRNKKNTPEKLNLNKYCPNERKVTKHTEKK